MRATTALKRALQTRADHTALVAGRQKKTWAEVGDRVKKGASVLADLGVAPRDRVAVLSLNNATYFELLFACPWINAVIVPMNTRWSIPETERGLADCAATLLLVDEEFVPHAEALKAKLPGLTIGYIGTGPCPQGYADYEALIARAAPKEEILAAPDDLWTIKYTGGTTGHPKGVMLSNLNAYTSAMIWVATAGFNEQSNYMHIAGFFHIVATAPAVAVTMAGGTNVIVARFEPEPTMRTIQENKVNYATFVPTMLNMMLNDPALPNYDLTSMGDCIYGGSPIPDALIRLAIEKLPTWRFIQGYGQTESTGILTSLPWEAHFGEGRANKRRATGRAGYGVEIRIVDEEGKEVPLDTTGEVVTRGNNVMAGYWNNPKATAEVIRDGWLHTGDAARMDEDGYITVVDRLKDMIVTGGENVFSTEVENAISSLPAVRECAVFGIPDEKWGEAVHAVVVLKAGQSATEEEIIAHCKTLIANYKCPRSVEFRDAMPLSAAGKIQKGTLRAERWKDRDRRVN